MGSGRSVTESLGQLVYRQLVHRQFVHRQLLLSESVAAWAAAGKDGKPMPNIPAMNAVWGPMGQAMADVISGKAAPDARFNAAQKEIEAAIKAGS